MADSDSPPNKKRKEPSSPDEPTDEPTEKKARPNPVSDEPKTQPPPGPQTPQDGPPVPEFAKVANARFQFSTSRTDQITPPSNHHKTEFTTKRITLKVAFGRDLNDEQFNAETALENAILKLPKKQFPPIYVKDKDNKRVRDFDAEKEFWVKKVQEARKKFATAIPRRPRTGTKGAHLPFVANLLQFAPHRMTMESALDPDVDQIAWKKVCASIFSLH